MNFRLILIFSCLITKFSVAQSWQSLPSFTASPLNSVNFISKDTGYVIDDNANKFKTTDGGLTWSPIIMPQVDFFKFTDRYNAIGYKFYPSSKRILLSTDNGGVSWDTIYSDTINEFQSYSRVNNSTIYLVVKTKAKNTMEFADQDTLDVFYSSDTGNTWAYRSSIIKVPFAFFGGGFGTNQGNLNDIYYWDTNELQKSSDGGFTWNNSYTFSSGSVNAASWFYDSNLVYIFFNDNSYIKTINGGSSWTPVSIPVSTIFYAVNFVSPTEGFVVGGDGISANALYKTVDGGSNWTLAGSSSLSAYFISVDFPVDSVGYSVGAGGSIVKYKDPLLSTNELNKVELTVNVFPNPASEYIQFSLSEFVPDKEYTYEIISAYGVVLAKNSFNGSVKEIGLSQFEKGTYFVKIYSKEMNLIKPFVRM